MKTYKYVFYTFVTAFLVSLLAFPIDSYAQIYSLNSIGGFEDNLPAYWHIGNEPGGSTLTWATDQSVSMGHSLKIDKSQTSDAAMWESENMCDLWSGSIPANVDIKLGAWIMTKGINTNPANDDERWWVSYAFYDSAGSLIGETKLPIDQSAANSSGFVADTNSPGETVLPTTAYKLIITFNGGKNATGTVWADNFIFLGRNGAWAGQDWNSQVGVPTGWFYWLPPNGGNDGQLNDGFENTVVTSETAHTGQNSLKFDMPFDREPHDGFISTRRFPLSTIDQNIKPGDILRMSVWIKASNLVPDSADKYPDTWSVGFTPGFFDKVGNDAGYSPIDQPDLQFKFPDVTSFGWTEYHVDYKVPDNPSVNSMELRLHVYSRFTGTIYFDDLSVKKLNVPDINAIGGFEQQLPAYWHKGNEPGGSTLTWATDQSVSMGHSLKIDKSQTSDAATWESDNMCDLWSGSIPANVDIKLGAWVMTKGINTNPANDDEKWWISYAFYDTTGNLIGETKLPIDQSSANSSGFVADTNSPGETVLPTTAYKMIISFVGGKNATGTVWADNFVFIGRNGAWAGQDWNTQVGVPTGWFYWLPPMGGNDGQLTNGFENTIVTNEAAHSGQYSLKFVMPFNRDPHDGFVSTTRFPLDTAIANIYPAGVSAKISNTGGGIKPGDIIRISVWIKASNLVPDSADKYPDTWSVGFTPGFFDAYGNEAGYSPIDQPDLQFKFPDVTSFDWTQYHVDYKVPDNPSVNSMEVRLHIYARFTGTVYFDDLSIQKLDVPDLNAVGGFEQQLPAFWHKGNEPGGSTLTWATDQSVSMGHSLKIDKSQTSDAAMWESDNMCDLWSPSVPANVDIKLGAWVMTKGINTNPANDDEKWWISYAFYDSAGSLIGETKLPIDQSTANSSGFVADTNSPGETVLPTTAYKMVISFVGGKNATGTVWADNFIFLGRNGAWAGQDWNTQVGVPTGWYYWLPPLGGNDGQLSNGFENTIVTSEAAHSGKYSLKFNMPFNRDPHDGFVGTTRFLLDSAQANFYPASVSGSQFPAITDIHPGDIIRLSVWIKASNLVPDSANKYPDTWSVGLTPGFFQGNGNNSGYAPIDQNDYQFKFPDVTSFDWTKYYLDITVPEDPSYNALEVRLHVYARFTGTVYFDDLQIEKIGATDVSNSKNILPADFTVFQNYPNPFNPTTTISYSLPKSAPVRVIVYDMLGREVKTLVNTEQQRGVHNVVWNADNNFGAKVSSGMYIYRVVAGDKVQVKKMVLLK